jgi:hypothetical protein
MRINHRGKGQSQKPPPGPIDRPHHTSASAAVQSPDPGKEEERKGRTREGKRSMDGHRDGWMDEVEGRGGEGTDLQFCHLAKCLCSSFLGLKPSRSTRGKRKEGGKRTGKRKEKKRREKTFLLRFGGVWFKVGRDAKTYLLLGPRWFRFLIPLLYPDLCDRLYPLSFPWCVDVILHLQAGRQAGGLTEMEIWDLRFPSGPGDVAGLTMDGKGRREEENEENERYFLPLELRGAFFRLL